MVILFTCVSVNNATGYTADAQLTELSSLQSAPGFELHWREWRGRGKFYEWMVLLRELVKEVNWRPVCMLQEHSETALSKIKFHL